MTIFNLVTIIINTVNWIKNTKVMNEGAWRDVLFHTYVRETFIWKIMKEFFVCLDIPLCIAVILGHFEWCALYCDYFTGDQRSSHGKTETL